MKGITVRLMPGADLKQSILEIARKQKLQAAIVACSVGSLRCVKLRLTVVKGKPAYKTMVGDFEIVSLQGTVAEKGTGAHLHIAVSDIKGHVWGGHLLDGCLVKTTVELVLFSFTDIRYIREHDPETGFQELTVRKR